MNEIIAKLTQQCYEYNETMQGTWFNKTKFSELIVRECMEWCDAHATIDGSAQQIRESIKKYFGVE